MEPKELLEEIGLTKVQAKIYLQLLYLKKAKVMDLYRETKIARSNLYHNLEKLKKLGLVKEEKKAKQRFFIPEEPKKLIKHFENKEKLAEELVGEIGEEENGKVKKPIRIYSRYSVEAHKKFWRENLEKPNLNYIEFGKGYRYWRASVVDLIGRKETIKYIKERMKRKIYFRSLSSVISAKEWNKFQEKHHFFPQEVIDLLNKYDRRGMLPGDLEFNIGMATNGQRTRFYSTSEEDFLVTVESKSLSGLILTMFDYIWEKSTLIKH